MKRMMSWVIGLSMALTLVALPLAQESAALSDGTYEATVSSVGGPLTVSVTVEDGALSEVSVLEINDTQGVYDEAAVRLPQMMVENQSLNVDGVTGATLSSLFIRNAAKEALSQAGDVSAFNEKVDYQAPAQQDREVDVVVVGGGLAGMSAAAAAAGRGLQVLVVEKNGFIGGDALISDQYIGKAATEPVNSAFPKATANFQELGIPMEAVEYYGIEGNRIWTEDPDNEAICKTVVNAMRKIVEDRGGEVLFETPAIGLLSEDGKVLGVVAKPKNQDSFEIHAKATVLASGGFSSNPELVAEYLPYAAGARAVGLGSNTGDAIAWAADVDAKLVAMDAPVASFYSVTASLGYYADYATTASHYVDANGDLLTEDTGYNSATMEIYQKIGTEHYFVIESQEDLESTYELPNDVTKHEYEHFVLSGAMEKLEGLGAIKERFGLENLDATFEQLGLNPDSTYYVSEATAGIYGTYGGYDIDDASHVLNTKDEIIPGLFAAGEVIGSREYRLTGAYGGGCGTGYATGWIAAQTIADELEAE